MAEGANPNVLMVQGLESLISPFAGTKGENFEEFLENFKEVATELGWSQNSQVIWFKNRLTGEARKFFKQSHLAKSKDFKMITEMFAEYYKSQSVDFKLSEVESIMQGPDESVISVKYRIRQGVEGFFKQRVDITSEEGKKAFDAMAFSILVKALRPELREKVCRGKENTFEGAIKLALEEEEVQGTLQKFEEITLKQGTYESDWQQELLVREEQIEDLRAQVNSLRRTPQRRENREYQIICDFCKRRGHRQAECRFWKIEKNKYKSGREGQQNLRRQNHRDNNTRNHFLGV